MQLHEWQMFAATHRADSEHTAVAVTLAVDDGVKTSTSHDTRAASGSAEAAVSAAKFE